jgi:hypothetical protein
VVQRQVLYLGEINDSQKASWLRCIEAFDPQARQQVRLALFPDDRPLPAHATACGVQVRLREFSIRRRLSRKPIMCCSTCCLSQTSRRIAN